jgi:hypothetical protein
MKKLMLQMSQKVGYILIPAVTKGESHASIQIKFLKLCSCGRSGFYGYNNVRQPVSSILP